MTTDLDHIANELNRRFFTSHPVEAARILEGLTTGDAADAAKRQPVSVLAPVWHNLLPETAAALLGALPEEMADQLLSDVPSQLAVRLLGFLPSEDVSARLARLEPALKADLELMLSYPNDTAGRLMNTAVSTFRRDANARDTLRRLRDSGMRTARSLFLVDDAQRLVGRASLTDVALAQPGKTLGELERPIIAAVRATDPLGKITQAFEEAGVLDLPVIDLDGVMLGAITHDDIARSIKKDATVDLQTMVGVSKEERALSSPLFAVRKRMPWLQINLITAFMAAAVVGVFEATIAQVTALAVLLPVVAGQSGNTGAQALAVTMRGLALREITVRQWARVMRKEVTAGFLNGIAIATTCGIGVFLWSQSFGLVVVIMSSMVLAMVAAAFAGALIPMALTRLGQDPATSSSIILTTVTDIAGFFAFLGIATVMLRFL
jgi:magnesium transporter